MTRHRTRSANAIGGYSRIFLFGNLVSDTPSNTLYTSEDCYDVDDDPGSDHSFLLSRWDASGLRPLDGSPPEPAWNGTLVQNYWPPGGPNSYSRQHLSMNNAINATDFVTLLARTNPSRPLVTPLELAQDVIDIPKMLKDAGRLLSKKPMNLTAKDIANQNLGIQFGWLPLVQDVKNLLDLQSHIHRRAEEIHRLYSSQGLKRRIRLGQDHAEQRLNDQIWYSELPGNAFVDLHKFTTSVKWGTVRWKPTSLPPFQPDAMGLNRQARNILLGASQEGVTQGLWNVLPWTWLIDWFLPVGDFLLQHSNTVPAVPVHMNVMRTTISETQATRTFRSGDAAWLQGGDGSMKFTTLERSQSSSALPSSLPFVGLKRLSILSSLFIQRFK